LATPLSHRLGLRGVRTSRWVFVVAGVALTAVIATNLIDLGVEHLKLSLLNANWQFSWSHDADTVALAVGVVTAVTGARRTSRSRWLWCALAVLLVLFFLDEASSVHAQIDQIHFGKFLYSPILLGFVICVWCLAADTDERVVLGWGLTMLFVSFGMHVAGLHVLRPLGYFNWIYESGVGFKEGTELAGLLIVVLGLWRLTSQRPIAGAATRS
jgi:hypothetical protein